MLVQSKIRLIMLASLLMTFLDSFLTILNVLTLGALLERLAAAESAALQDLRTAERDEAREPPVPWRLGAQKRLATDTDGNGWKIEGTYGILWALERS